MAVKFEVDLRLFDAAFQKQFAEGASRFAPDEFAEILEIDESRVTREARFADDLDADSLALIELVEVLEAELGERTVGFSVDDEDLAELSTVGEAVDYVVARLGATG